MRQTVPLGASSTELWVGSGSSAELLGKVQESHKKMVVISDHNVTDALRAQLPAAEHWLTVPAGEASKSVERVGTLWSELVTLGLDRSSAVVALGGGVVGDLAGFAASTFMRGVPFYSIPTSLLAMVDASVGGKVGIDLPEGKNLVGQFYPGKIVAVDPNLLTTLPDKEWSAGMAEVIKHGILKGPVLWQQLLEFQSSDRNELKKTEELVEAAVNVKVEVVKEDPYERTGLRATLNLGHSYGHAIEWSSEFGLGHGEAVSLGLVAGLRLSRELGLLEQDFESELLQLLKRWNLPVELEGSEELHTWSRLGEALSRDKKNKDGKWCFILPKSVGEVTTIYGPDKEAVKIAYDSLKGKEACRA